MGGNPFSDYYQESSWKHDSLQGATGSQGATAAQGAAGNAQGLQGATGVGGQGVQGTLGASGSQGQAGSLAGNNRCSRNINPRTNWFWNTGCGR